MGMAGAMCHALFVLCALLTGLVAYYMYQSVPADVDRPWTVRAWLGARQAVYHYSLLHEKLTSTDRLETSRRIYNSLDKYKMDNQPDMPDIKVSTTLLGEIRVRLYDPKSGKTKGPAILYFHGGGWTMGSIDSAHTVCRTLASKSKMLVIAVSFSLSPEHGFPQALDDAENATRYFMDDAQRYNVDVGRVALAGDDTGGNLAAALALRSRDRHWPHQPKLQILLYPILQAFDFNTPSYTQNRHVLAPLNNPVHIARNTLFYMKQDPNYARTLTSNEHTSNDAKAQYAKLVSHELLPEKFRKGYEPFKTEKFDESFAKEISTFVLHPHFSPMIYGTGTLKDIAKAYIVTMEHDSVRDDGLMYARRLRQSGGRAVSRHYDNGYHDCLSLLGYTELADKVMDDLVDFIGKDL